jgi:nucleotide-binding universal stress UspA family protein
MLQVADILCLVSPASAALAEAAHLARHLGATLHVVPQPLSESESDSADPLRHLWTEDLPVDVEVLNKIVVERPNLSPDSPAAVLTYVEKSDIELVVADTPSGRGPVPPLAAETTRPLIKHLDCPVFVVGDVERPTAMHDIFVPTDLSESALRAFKHAIALAHLYGAAVHVLHVIDSLPYVALTPTDRLSLGPTTLSQHRGQRQLRAFLREGDTADVPVHAHLAYGNATDQVLRFIEQEDIDLMVLSSHGNEPQPHGPLGPVAERVLGRATCPLFLCRAFGRSLLASISNSDAPSSS